MWSLEFEKIEFLMLSFVKIDVPHQVNQENYYHLKVGLLIF